MYKSLSLIPELKPVAHKGVALLPEPLLYYSKNALHHPPRSVALESEYGRPPITATFSNGYFYLLWDISVLTVFSAELKPAGAFQCENKYGLGMERLASGLFLCGVNEAEFIELTVEDRGRQGPVMVPGRRFKAEIYSWVKGFQAHEEFVVINGMEQIFAYRLPSLELTTRLNGMVRKDNPLTKSSFNLLYRYFLAGHVSGDITVWKAGKRDMIHKFKAHKSAVAGFSPDKDPRCFWSVAPDSICLWNLDTFTLVYCHQFFDNHEGLKFFGDCLYTLRPLMVSRVGSPLELICDLRSEVLFVDRQHSPEGVQLTLNNNMGVRMERARLYKSDVHKNSTLTFYPPLKSKGILQIVGTGLPNRFLMLVENGDICWTRLEDSASLIEDVIQVDKVADEEGKILLQKASCILVPRRKLPPLDPEVIVNLQLNPDQPRKEARADDPQLIIGCSRGTIIAVSLNCPTRIFTRLTYHREPIVCLKEIESPQGETFLVSLCKQHNLRVIRTTAQSTFAVVAVNTRGELSRLQTDQGHFFMLAQEALHIFELNDRNELVGRPNFQHPEHEGRIHSLSVNSALRLVLTTGEDDFIKVRTYCKVLVFQIAVSPALNHAFFLDDSLNILVANDGKISLCRESRIDIDLEEARELNEDFLGRSDEITTMEEFFGSREKEKLPAIKKRDSPTRPLSKPGKAEDVLLDKTQIGRTGPSRSLAKAPDPVLRQTRAASFNRKEKEQFQKRMQLIKQLQSSKMEVPNQDLRAVVRPRRPGGKQSLLDKFMREKVMGKGVLTRRDVTTNRIIMKNIIREYMDENGNQDLQI